ncbi:hypothetical protein NEMIN01_0295 [Nematocida minor]|uniref:uncharacterized protein n=1 Tax=Nematocida minor TaxID=1912983 RepID=UPI00221F4FAF|nr:uncharacterized protein NEMIN01_0295 [Nematocida minor]KAI5189129.1 hypothetical protein NEMIN01_0295 [Nematocida minor]
MEEKMNRKILPNSLNAKTQEDHPTLGPATVKHSTSIGASETDTAAATRTLSLTSLSLSDPEYDTVDNNYHTVENSYENNSYTSYNSCHSTDEEESQGARRERIGSSDRTKTEDTQPLLRNARTSTEHSSFSGRSSRNLQTRSKYLSKTDLLREQMKTRFVNAPISNPGKVAATRSSSFSAIEEDSVEPVLQRTVDSNGVAYYTFDPRDPTSEIEEEESVLQKTVGPDGTIYYTFSTNCVVEDVPLTNKPNMTGHDSPERPVYPTLPNEVAYDETYDDNYDEIYEEILENSNDKYMADDDSIADRIKTPLDLFMHANSLMFGKPTIRNIARGLMNIVILGVVLYTASRFTSISLLVILVFIGINHFLSSSPSNSLTLGLIFKVLALFILVSCFPSLLFFGAVAYSCIVINWFVRSLLGGKIFDTLSCLIGLTSTIALYLSHYWLERVYNNVLWVILLQSTIFASLTFNSAVATSLFVSLHDPISNIFYGNNKMNEYKEKLEVLKTMRTDRNNEYNTLTRDKSGRDHTLLKQIIESEKEEIEKCISFAKKKNERIYDNFYRSFGSAPDGLMSFKKTHDILVSLHPLWILMLLFTSIIAGLIMLFMICYLKSRLHMLDYILTLVQRTKSLFGKIHE